MKCKTINLRDYEITQLVTTGTGLLVHEINSGIYYCISYDTIVAVYDNVSRTLYRTWDGFSRTTAKHIGLFCHAVNAVCSESISYFQWKTSPDYDGEYSFDLYGIRHACGYTKPRMYYW